MNVNGAPPLKANSVPAARTRSWHLIAAVEPRSRRDAAAALASRVSVTALATNASLYTPSKAASLR
jgi:hypothetical protein